MNSNFHEIENLYARIIAEIEDPPEQCKYLLKVYHDLVLALSELSSLHFNTLFARVSFIASRYPMPKGWVYALQIPRREIQKRELTDQELLPVLKGSIGLLFELVRHEFAEGDSMPEITQPPPVKISVKRRAGKYKRKFARVIALEWDKDEKCLSILDEEEPDAQFTLQYCVPGVNDIFSDTLELALREIGLPMILGLVDVECTEDGHYLPGYVVILPDLLMDVTTITQVKSNGYDPLAINLIDVFLPSKTTEAIMAGHIANYFLDELIRDTTKPYEEMFAETFKVYPVEFVRMTDEQIRGLYQRMRSQYENILNVIEERFPALGIDRKFCVIEPSYFSPRFGVKGRLDLYFEREDQQSASIIELKSSKPFKPNSYGLSSENYHQTLLYDLLIRSTYVAGYNRANYILYSAMTPDSLRYAASVEVLQKETIHNRNQLVLLQFRLMKQDNAATPDLFTEIDPVRFDSLKGYVKKNIDQWHAVYSLLSPGEQMYFRSFSAFITREHTLARIGSDRGDGSGGLAGLWLDKIQAKEERYQILQGLRLLSIEQNNRQTTIRFAKSERTNPLANFRSGDIAIMYPSEEKEYIDPTRYQLHRANVLMIDATHIVIRLYNTQIHTGQIEKYTFWNIEHDLLDSSFRSLYQSLWALMSCDILKRQYILGLIAPPMPLLKGERISPPELTTTQAAIYHEAIDAGMLYLLWGPPGTGKTSMMLRSWVKYYFEKTPLRIVLLAYTNKAVDEICEALHNSGPELSKQYIRIGSTSATGEPYRHRLFDQVISGMTTRKEIRQRLEETRVFVATVSSLQGKKEMLELIPFDVAIIDEASQLLEPSVVGLLTRFKKTILIGDHMQLPAVSIQPEPMSRFSAEQQWNESIGLTSMNMSYFERLYRLYQKKGWHHLIGILSEQGRMHADIMQFANQVVYGGLLRVVEPVRQHLPLAQILHGLSDPFSTHRLIFIPSNRTLAETYLKTNQHEATITIKLIALWTERIRTHQLGWSIGVITPFRAQIAAITYLAHQENMDLTDVTIDTVERYQGGARDIIIMSSTVNANQTLLRITSTTEDGIDRKLNVAVTRARQQFILIGTEEVLANAHAYRSLIAMSKRVEPGAFQVR